MKLIIRIQDLAIDDGWYKVNLRLLGLDELADDGALLAAVARVFNKAVGVQITREYEVPRKPEASETSSAVIRSDRTTEKESA